QEPTSLVPQPPELRPLPEDQGPGNERENRQDAHDDLRGQVPVDDHAPGGQRFLPSDLREDEAGTHHVALYLPSPDCARHASSFRFHSIVAMKTVPRNGGPGMLRVAGREAGTAKR